MTPWRRTRGTGNLPPSTIERRSERYLLNSRLTAMIHGGQQEARIQTHALDISEGGIGTLSLEGWGAGVHVDLNVSLPPESDRLEIQAIVRHQTGVRCGLEFVDVSPGQQQTLRDVCKFLAGRPLRPGTPKTLS